MAGLPLVPVHPVVIQPRTADGLKVTLSGIGNGLTVNKQGRKLLPHPFVFQCPPLDQFTITHAQNFGTYDTIDDDQFIRRGSRQLETWQFDTLVMYLGVDWVGKHAPSWVPYPTRQPRSSQYRRPEWYVSQLRALHNAGSPFWFTAAFHRSTRVRRIFAVLTGFSEVHKHGEGDAIYLAGVTFSEWRDPGDASKKKRGHTKLPVHVRLDQFGDAHEVGSNVYIRPRSVASGKGLGWTLGDLAHFYYGDATKWRLIAKANHLKGGAGRDPILKHWYPHKYVAWTKAAVPQRFVLTLVVPQLPPTQSSPRTPPATTHTVPGRKR